IMGIWLFILYALHIYRSALQGMGDTVVPMISGFIELVMRISIVLFLPLLIGRRGVYYAEVGAWAGAAVILIITYYHRLHRLEQTSQTRL
ncbi:MAG: MATE family efflux transporter, partial [Eubacteriales bacterium]|nr:MATE family efflux transporter [Eubacteriales bacterium]